MPVLDQATSYLKMCCGLDVERSEVQVGIRASQALKIITAALKASNQKTARMKKLQ